MKKIIALAISAILVAGFTVKAEDKKECSEKCKKEMLEKYDSDKDGKLSKDERSKISNEDKKKMKDAGLHGDKKKKKS